MQWPTELVTSDTLAVFLLKKCIAKGIVQPTECGVKSWHAAMSPADLEPATSPRVFCGNPGLQQPTCKMPEVCPERSWNPECTSPSTANPDRIPCAHANLLPRLPSKLHRYRYTPQILLLPISTMSWSWKSTHRLELGLHPWTALGFLFWVHTTFYLSSSLREFCNLWLYYCSFLYCALK